MGKDNTTPKKQESTRDLLKRVGPNTAKGQEILKAIGENSTGWMFITRDEKTDGSGASRQYQCVINGYLCAHDIWTPKDKKGKWLDQSNEFHLLIEKDKKFSHVMDLYDYAMTLPKGSQSMKKTVNLTALNGGN